MHSVIKVSDFNIIFDLRVEIAVELVLVERRLKNAFDPRRNLLFAGQDRRVLGQAFRKREERRRLRDYLRQCVGRRAAFRSTHATAATQPTERESSPLTLSIRQLFPRFV